MKDPRAAPRTVLISGTITVMMALTSVGSWAAPGDPGAGIAATVHDFTQGTQGVGPDTTEAVGVCTFCHTPHKAQTTKLLWNHTLEAKSFSWDDPNTTAGTKFATIAEDSYKGPTAKCLSCHDGSIAVGDVAWWKEGKPASPLNPTKLTGEFKITDSASKMNGNHPVAMPYPYQNAKSTYNGSTTGDGAVLTEWQADPILNNGANSQIRLFNDSGGGNIAAGPVLAETGIECSSCHDPHNKAATEDLFLRAKLTGSTQADGYICLQCHVK